MPDFKKKVATGKRRSAARRGQRKAKPAAALKSQHAGIAGYAEGEDGGLDPEGYFVARVRGEEAARQAPHPMTESSAEDLGPAPAPPPLASWDTDDAGELPWSYEDDALVALPRDPRTLFLYWDFAPSVVAQGYEGLENARLQIGVFVREGEDRYERIRTIDFTLEARCYYVHDLEPGRFYRAEIHLMDNTGRDRLLGRVSNLVGLPPAGPSATIDDHFIRIPWDRPLSPGLREGHTGAPFPEEARAVLARLSDSSRFSGRVWGGSGGNVGGRPFSPFSGSSSPGLWEPPVSAGKEES